MLNKIFFLVSLLFVIIIFPVRNISQTSLDHKIAQMLMVGFSNSSDYFDTLKSDLQNKGLGGVIVFGRNIESREAIPILINSLKELSEIPLFVSIDQEGGRVARFNGNNGYSSTYNAYTLGTIFNNEDSTRSQASMMADWLAEAGVNINLAPVADVNVDSLSPAIGKLKRSFSKDPVKVYQHTSWFIDEFHKQNIMTSLKHFPGHGSAQQDSHNGFTDITLTWADSELVPYNYLIADNYADFVMTGHLYNANLDSLYPASLSYQVTTELLRNQMGFQGLVITDELFMQAISANYGFEESLVLAINAGVDILLFSTNEYEGKSLVSYAVQTIKDKIDQGVIQISRIEESYQRILDLKNKYIPTGLKENISPTPSEYALCAYPNPFNPSTKIDFRGKAGERVKIEIFNMIGQQIEVLYEGISTGSTQVFQLNMSGLSSGVYFVRAAGQNNAENLKLLLLK